MRTKAATKTAQIRELFIEELAGVQGGAPISGNPLKDLLCCSTMACCEEGQCCEGGIGDLISLDD